MKKYDDTIPVVCIAIIGVAALILAFAGVI